MQFKIKQAQDGVQIDLAGTEGKQDELLAAFRECQEGRCSCPTNEYAKLESLEIGTEADTIHLHLKAKPGESFDAAELNQCLQYTEAKVTGKG